MTLHGETQALVQYGDNSILVQVQMFTQCIGLMTVIVKVVQQLICTLFQALQICAYTTLVLLELKIELITVKPMIKEDH